MAIYLAMLQEFPDGTHQKIQPLEIVFKHQLPSSCHLIIIKVIIIIKIMSVEDLSYQFFFHHY